MKNWINIYLSHARHLAWSNIPANAPEWFHVCHVAWEIGDPVLLETIREYNQEALRLASQWSLNVALMKQHMPTNLRGTSNYKIDLRAIRFSSLREVDFRYVDMRWANISNIPAKEACFIEVDLRDVIGRATNFDHSEFHFADLRGSDFFRSWFSGVWFYKVNAKGACFEKVFCPDTFIEESNFDEVNFELADMVEAGLSGSRFVGANFCEASLSRATAIKSILRKADFRWADLSEVDLQGADLRGADLRESRRDRTIVSNALIDRVRWFRGS